MQEQFKLAADKNLLAIAEYATSYSAVCNNVVLISAEPQHSVTIVKPKEFPNLEIQLHNVPSNCAGIDLEMQVVDGPRDIWNTKFYKGYEDKIWKKIPRFQDHGVIRRKYYFQCLVCDKKYCSFGSLKIHLNKHAGFSPFSCEQCSKKFSSKQRLNGHNFRKHGNIALNG